MPQEKIALSISTDNTHFLPAPPRSLKRPPVRESNKAGDLDLAVTELECSAPANVFYRTIKLFVASGHMLTTKLSHPGPVNVIRDSGTESANPGWLQRRVELSRCAAGRFDRHSLEMKVGGRFCHHTMASFPAYA